MKKITAMNITAAQNEPNICSTNKSHRFINPTPGPDAYALTVGKINNRDASNSDIDICNFNEVNFTFNVDKSVIV